MQETDSETIALIQRCQQADEDAWRTLIEKYERPLFEFLYKEARDEAVAEDLLQETWLGVVRNFSSFRADCRFLNWCRRIAHNKFLDWLRRETSRGRGRHDSVDEADPETGEPFIVLPDPEPQKRQGYALVFDVLERLSEECRELLTLHHIVGLSYEEIGDVLQLEKSGTVSSRMSRCLERAQTLKERVRSA